MPKKCDVNDLCPWSGCNADLLVDLSLLNKFCGMHIDRCFFYADLLKTVSEYVHKQCSPNERHSRERELDMLADEMSVPLSPPLKKSEMSAISWFLTEVRAEWTGKPVKCKGFIHTNAHDLASFVISNANEVWRNARRMHCHSSTPAWEYFYKYYVTGRLPSAMELLTLIKLEYALARKVLLKEQCESSQQTTNT